MIDETLEEMASLYVLGSLEKDQCARFEAELLGSQELQDLVAELEDEFSALALVAPLRKAPPGVQAHLFEQIRATKTPAKVLRVSFLPWALAAGLAVAATLLFLQQNKLQKQVAELQSRDLRSQTRVAVLQSQVEAFAGGSAVVVWDETEQKGLVKFNKLPAQAGKDYQLWALDPAKKEPVDAGLVPVINDGSAKVNFQPRIHLGRGTKFAVSVEEKGGSKQPAGQIIFVGE